MRELGAHRQEIIDRNIFGHYDDVTMGVWIATHLSQVPLETFLQDIVGSGPLSEGHVFVKCSRSTVDYVMAPAEQHLAVASAFHYHFHSDGARDMLAFHQRYFAQ